MAAATAKLVTPSPGRYNWLPERLRPSPRQTQVIDGLLPYLWPKDRPDLQRTVLISLGLMLLAKLITVTMPFAYKWATDALISVSSGTITPLASAGWFAAAPIGATLLYGLIRITMTSVAQFREGLFAKVAMHAVRNLALSTFVHMHQLSLRFHLERKTGGLTRVLERGRTGVENITRMLLMMLIPTIVEFVLVLGVCAWQFDWRYVLVICGMIAGFSTSRSSRRNGG